MLPTIVSKIEDDLSASSKDVAKAITSDLPVSVGELEKMRGGPGSSFAHALRIARRVILLSFCLCCQPMIMFFRMFMEIIKKELENCHPFRNGSLIILPLLQWRLKPWD